MTKVVIDTSVLVSGVLKKHGQPAAVLALIGDRKIIWYVSAAVIAEYKGVLALYARRPSTTGDLNKGKLTFARDYRAWFRLVSVSRSELERLRTPLFGPPFAIRHRLALKVSPNMKTQTGVY